MAGTSPSRDPRPASAFDRDTPSAPFGRACRWRGTKSRLQEAFSTEGLPMNKPILEAKLLEAQLQSAVPTPKPQRRPGRRTVLTAVAIAGAALAVSYGIYWWNVGRWMQTTDDAYVGGNTAPLATQVP